MKEYIIKIDEDKKDIMGNCPLVEKPQELVRCRDCKYGTEPILAYRKGCVWCERIDRHNDADWFCADGERGEQE